MSKNLKILINLKMINKENQKKLLMLMKILIVLKILKNKNQKVSKVQKKKIISQMIKERIKMLSINKWKIILKNNQKKKKHKK